MKCKDCKWWIILGEEEPSGQCRKLSPRHTVGDISNEENPALAEEAAWPWTQDDDWCGEFVINEQRSSPRC